MGAPLCLRNPVPTCSSVCEAQILAGLKHVLRAGDGGQSDGNRDGGTDLPLALAGAVLKMQFTEGQVAAKPDFEAFPKGKLSSIHFEN